MTRWDGERYQKKKLIWRKFFSLAILRLINYQSRNLPIIYVLKQVRKVSSSTSNYILVQSMFVLATPGNVVMQLLQHIPLHQWFKLFIDSWYTGVSLATTLINQGIGRVGAFGANRLRNCQLSSDKELRHKGRGSAEIKICVSGNMEVWEIRWFDNKAVTILTTFEVVMPLSQIKGGIVRSRKSSSSIYPQLW